MVYLSAQMFAQAVEGYICHLKTVDVVFEVGAAGLGDIVEVCV